MRSADHSRPRASEVAKRTVDVIGAALLLALFAPVLAVIAAAVKLADPAGPVLYRHERIGRGGVPLTVVKFRTMWWELSTGPGRPYASAEDALRGMGRGDLVGEFRLRHKLADDPRVLPVGRFLRRTSLDELPQLVAALRGELSLIGPRPVTRAELPRYGHEGARLLAHRPGITGLWQVSGRTDVSYDERVALDLFYLDNWSLALDLAILARTATAVLAKRGAR